MATTTANKKKRSGNARSSAANARREASERFDRAKDVAGDAAGKAVRVLAAGSAILLGIAVFLGGVLPFAFSLLLGLSAKVAFAFGAGLTAGGAWFAKASDEPMERLIWLVIFVGGAAVVIASLGVM